MRPYAPAKFKAVHFGKHQVEDEKCRSFCLGVRDKALRPRRAVDSETMGLQVMRHQARDVLLVLHERDEFPQRWRIHPGCAI